MQGLTIAMATMERYTITTIQLQPHYYEESQCNLPAGDCKHRQCSFNFTEKVCILGHIKYNEISSQTFADIRTDTSQIAHKPSGKKGFIYIICGSIVLSIAALTALAFVTYCACLIRRSIASRTSNESQPLLSNVN